MAYSLVIPGFSTGIELLLIIILEFIEFNSEYFAKTFKLGSKCLLTFHVKGDRVGQRKLKIYPVA